MGEEEEEGRGWEERDKTFLLLLLLLPPTFKRRRRRRRATPTPHHFPSQVKAKRDGRTDEHCPQRSFFSLPFRRRSLLHRRGGHGWGKISLRIGGQGGGDTPPPERPKKCSPPRPTNYILMYYCLAAQKNGCFCSILPKFCRVSAAIKKIFRFYLLFSPPLSPLRKAELVLPPPPKFG